MAGESLGVDGWTALSGVLALLAAGFVLGALAERFKQSAILGYLCAGLVVGPNGMALMGESASVHVLAELGVALLLFSIGLEFSWARLRGMGPQMWGGTLQILVAVAVGGAIALWAGAAGHLAVLFGCMLALSSTAYVLRMFTARSELEAPHARTAIGTLLVQDVAVVPMVLILGVLQGGGTFVEATLSLLRMVALAAGLVVVSLVVFRFVVPRLLRLSATGRNRELGLLLAVVSGLGSAMAAHLLGISPAIGAFLAGMLLAESPYATQVRSEIGALRALLMTLFFGSIGMLGDPAWMLANLLPLVGVVVGLVLLKSILAGAALAWAGSPRRQAMAAGLCLAQVGEFSFVLADMARAELIELGLFRWVVSATIGTLALSPFLIAMAARIVLGPARRAASEKGLRLPACDRRGVLVVGFGPTGQAVARALYERGVPVSIVDMNPRSIEQALLDGYEAHVGDASHFEVLEHAGLGSVSALVVTAPDPTAVKALVSSTRLAIPDLLIYARARYHVHVSAVRDAGADVVVDEEALMGQSLAQRVVESLPVPEPPRSGLASTTPAAAGGAAPPA